VIFRPELVEKFLAGQKTETRRVVQEGKPCPYKVGRDYAVQPGRTKPGVARIRVLEVRREILGIITDDGARREGFDHRVPFFRHWGDLHGSVDMEQEVWVIRFELVEKKRSGGAILTFPSAGAL
jgi:hypothetical protein